MGVDVVSITLPLPPATLSGHNTGHWRSKVKLIKDSRAMAMFYCRKSREKWEAAIVSYTFHVPNLRRTDAANLVQRCKPYIDGVVDAGLIPDDCWTILKIGRVFVCLATKETSRVVLDFHRAEPFVKQKSK
jgi:crossover junction endodeoxyribonuclease RusA